MRNERGAALLSVLLLVAILSVIAVAAVDRLNLATRLAGNLQATEQARLYGQAAELIAIRRIGATLQADPSRTTLAGDWEGREVNVPIDLGTATATLTDGGNCFNLNSLVEGQPGQPLASRPAGIAQFTRLMELLEISPPVAASVAAATADFVDSDIVPQPGGAEDQFYQALKPGYRTANTLLTDPSELRAVAGVSSTLYTRLRPYLCTLPVTDLSPININTLRPEKAALLAMLSPALAPARAAAALGVRPATGFASVDAFRGLPQLAGVVDDLSQLRVATRWFGLRLRITLADAEFEQQALIDAGTRPARLVRRSYGEPT